MSLTDIPVRKAMLSMIGPASIGMLLTFLFQLVDTYFVGQLGVSELAAISFAYPVYLLVIALFMGIATGVSSTIGKALGEMDEAKAKFMTMISQLTFMALTIAIGIGGYFSISPLFSLLGADIHAIS